MTARDPAGPLSPAARDIIARARPADGPTAADKVRVRAALFAELGLPGGDIASPDPGPGIAATASTSSTGGAAVLAAKIAVVALVAAAIAVAIGFTVDFGDSGRDATSAPIARSPVDQLPAGQLPAGQSPVDQLSAGQSSAGQSQIDRSPIDQTGARVAPAKSSRQRTRPRPRPRGGDQPGEKAPSPGASPSPEPNSIAALRHEHRLIRGAKRALQSGRAERALDLLADHAERFARGQLAQERMALRIIALCKLGQNHRAEPERRRFHARWPGSPHSGNIARACGEPKEQ